MSARLEGLASWTGFEAAAPELAAAGRRLLWDGKGIAIGFLATAGADGTPHLAPVCPILCDGWLHLSVAAGSPKRRDLDHNGRYVLHAFLGSGDAEFQVSGLAERIDSPEARNRVHAAIPFPAFGRDDPIYRLWLARCLCGYWENAGQPDTRPVRQRWRAS